MASNDHVLDVAGVADLLGYPDVQSFDRRLRRLIREFDFPRPLPGLAPRRWTRAAVLAWLRRSGDGPQAPSPAAAPLPEGDNIALHPSLARLSGRAA
ncbi:MAG: hypothetical protein ACR650_09675 [Methylocystis sp.]